MSSLRFLDRWWRSMGLLGLLGFVLGCSGGGSSPGHGGSPGSAGASVSSGGAGGGLGGAAPGSAGSAGSSMGGTGLGAGGATGGGGAAALPAAPAGEHFCACDLTEAGAWAFGKQKSCRVTWAKTGTLTAEQKSALDYGCEAPYCTVVTSCPRTAPEAVGLCAGADSPVIPTTTYTFIEKANITPDATAFGLNALGICGSPPYDLAGNAVATKCTGTLQATVDGAAISFSNHLLCWFKSDGVKSQYFVSGQDATQNKTINLNVMFDGAAYSVPGDAIAPGFGYLENNTAFAFPKDATNIAVTVSQFAPAGAHLQATFSPGELYTQPGGKGTGPRTFTDGMVDVAVTF